METLTIADALRSGGGAENGLCLKINPEGADHAQVSPDGKLLLVGALGQATTCNFVTAQGFHQAPAPAACADARSMTFSSDSRYLLIHAEDGRVLVWDAARRENEVVHEFSVRDQAATACSLWGTGQVIAGYRNGAVALMPPVAPGEHDIDALRVLFQHDHAVTCLQQDAEGQRLVSCDGSGRVVVFDRSLAKDATCGHTAHHSAVTHAAFTPDGTQLVTADATGRIFIADLEAPGHEAQQSAADDAAEEAQSDGSAVLLPAMVHDVEQAVTSLTCSADGRWLAVTYAHVGLTLCDLHAGRASGQYKKAFVPLAAAPAPKVLFCAEGTYLAVQSAHSMALMFELPHLQLQEAALALAPSGQTAALCMLPGKSIIGAGDPQGVWRFGSCAWLFDGGRRVLQQELSKAVSAAPRAP